MRLNNQSALHARLTSTAAYFWRNRGAKWLQYEVTIPPLFLGMPNKKKDGIVESLRADMLAVTHSASLIYSDLHRGSAWQHLSSMHQPVSILCESKASREDFKRDIGGKFNFLHANINCVVYPWGMLEDDEIPDGWFGLKCSKEGKRVMRVIVKKGRVVRHSAERHLKMYDALLERADNGKYNAWIDYHRDIVDGTFELEHMSKTLRAIAAYADGANGYDGVFGGIKYGLKAMLKITHAIPEGAGVWPRLEKLIELAQKIIPTKE